MTSLEVSQLTKSYKDLKVLDNWNYNFSEGVLYGLVGKNGSGKTTLLKSIAHLIPFDSGSVDLVPKMSRISYVSDEIELPKYLTGFEFLSMIQENWDSKINFMKLAEQLNLKEYLETGIYAYSKGMQQKIRLVSALISDPTLLLLDEPLTGVDQKSSDEIIKLLKNLLLDGKIIIYASHLRNSFDEFNKFELVTI